MQASSVGRLAVYRLYTAATIAAFVLSALLWLSYALLVFSSRITPACSACDIGGFALIVLSLGDVPVLLYVYVSAGGPPTRYIMYNIVLMLLPVIYILVHGARVLTGLLSMLESVGIPAVQIFAALAALSVACVVLSELAYRMSGESNATKLPLRNSHSV